MTTDLHCQEKERFGRTTDIHMDLFLRCAAMDSQQEALRVSCSLQRTFCQNSFPIFLDKPPLQAGSNLQPSSERQKTVDFILPG